MDRKSVKRNLLILWTVTSLGWMALSWNIAKVDTAVHAYKNMMMYENMIISGNNSKTIREMYFRSAQRTNESAKNIGLFLLLGFGVPLVTLALGNLWLRKKPK